MLYNDKRTDRGIRPTAYSTVLTVNPSTYDTVKTARAPHGVGYVWASMLYEMYWGLVDKHGFNPDLDADWSEGGNNLATQLVIYGMKFSSPASPASSMDATPSSPPNRH